MKRRDFLKRSLSSLKIKLGFLEGEFEPHDPDRPAAWTLYVEFLTRVTTQRLASKDDDEKTALDSIHALFPLTREILRRHGSGCAEYAKLAIPVLNQIIPSRQNGIGSRWQTCSRAPSAAANSAPTCPLSKSTP